MSKFYNILFSTRFKRIILKVSVNVVFSALLTFFLSNINLSSITGFTYIFIYLSFFIVALLITANVLISIGSETLTIQDIKKKGEIDKYKRKNEQLVEDNKEFFKKINIVGKVLQHYLDFGKFEIKDINNILGNKNEVIRLQDLLDWLRNKKSILLFIITQVYKFFTETSNIKDQEFRVTFMEKTKDNKLDIVTYMNSYEQCPRTKAKGIMLSEGEGVAGKAWETTGRFKRIIISDVEKHLELPVRNQIFKVLHEEQTFNIKSIFSIPVFNPYTNHKFYGVLNVDTNKLNDPNFQEIEFSREDKLILQLRPYLNQIVYACEKYELLKDRKFIIESHNTIK